jgi:hypothetical protein
MVRRVKSSIELCPPRGRPCAVGVGAVSIVHACLTVGTTGAAPSAVDTRFVTVEKTVTAGRAGRGGDVSVAVETDVTAMSGQRLDGWGEIAQRLSEHARVSISKEQAKRYERCTTDPLPVGRIGGLVRQRLGEPVARRPPCLLRRARLDQRNTSACRPTRRRR